ncbi:MAG TPA: carboxypeptidase-like regulatory domain-containing protein, partial [Gemmatimonadaceae bacterium]|nr:carboxypeptidase-like regulatory domain-containing protein [Gemmatimonadaceae bacterium]
MTFGLRVAAMSAAIALVAPPVAPAQQPSAPDTTAGTVVSGEVYDSVQAAAIGGAIVQLVSLPNPAVSFSVRSDSLGRYSIAHVPPGTYLIGFVDPMLSELGLSMIEQQVDIGATPIDHLRLAIPGQRAMHDRIC